MPDLMFNGVVPVYQVAAAASHGVLSDHKTIYKFGYNLDIGLTEETVWAVGGEFDQSTVTSAQTLSIVSTSANDTNGGTGAWLVAVFGLDADYNEQSELAIALNGTNAVTSSLSYRAVNRVAVAYSGSTKGNVGNITLKQSTSQITLAYIAATDSITQQMIYTVPAGYSGYLQDINIIATKAGGGQSPVIEFEVYTWNPTSATKYLVKKLFLDVSKETNLVIPQTTANLTGEKVTIFFNAKSDTASSKAFCSFSMLLMKNRV